MFLRSLPALCALSASAFSESVYVDLGSSPPSSSYAAAASAPGVWNTLPFSSNNVWQPAVDTQGSASSIQMLLAWECDSSGCGAPPAGDDGALLGDWFNADCYASQHKIHLSGLAPGQYRVHVYGFSESACLGTFPSTLSVSTADAFSTGTIVPWTGSFATGNHLQLVTNVSAGSNVVLAFGGGSYTGPAGFQFEQITSDIAPYCFGAQGGCPCAGSNGNTTGGCASSFSAAGGTMSGSGSPIVGADSLTLVVNNVSPAALTLFQGTQTLNAPATFGDGLRCASGTITRIVLRFAPGGTLVYPDVGDPPISVAGLVPLGGGTRYYQGWFRDSSFSHCTPATFNLTSAVAVVWH